MAGEEVLALLKELAPLLLPPARRRQDAVTDAAADQIAEVVAQHRGRDRDGEHDRERPAADDARTAAAIRLVSPGTGRPADSIRISPKRIP